MQFFCRKNCNISKKMFQELRKHKIFINDFEYCPYHPNAKIKRFRKISNLRKPNNGMIKKILKKWPVNIKKSFMIGDSVMDEMCAKKSGIKFYYTSKKFNLLCSEICKYL